MKKDKEDIKLPQYFQEIEEPEKYYGEITRKEDRWVVNAEPQVTMLIKKLFPLTNISERGIAEFPINKRQLGDLNWLMIRYPLKINNLTLWRRDIESAKEHYKERVRINQNISSREPSTKFKGHLFDFQKLGLSFLENNKKCLLADEMGLGKTVQTLAYLSERKRPIVIVTPPHLLSQWEEEIKTFLGDKVKVQILKGLNPKNNPMEEADIYLIHYLILRGWDNTLTELEFDTIIFDEIQELRRSGSSKFYSAFNIAQGRDSIIGLSGTPIYNYGAEIWNVMNIIEPMCLGDWEFFTREWCGSIGNQVIVEPEKLGQYMLNEGLMLRRRKENVLDELPPKRKIIQGIDLNEELYVKLIEKSVQISYKIPTLTTKTERKKIGTLTLDAVNNARRASGIAKASHVADFVNLVLASGEPCLLFAYHHSVIDIYMRLLKEHNPRCITGRQDKEEKKESVKSFMNGDTDLLIINLRTTAGLNLQRARCVVFGELDWSPAVHKQAEDRIHRIGQKDSVLSYYLIAKTEADMEIMRVLGLKEQQFLGLMHDKAETKDDILQARKKSNEFISSLLENLRNREDKDFNP